MAVRMRMIEQMKYEVRALAEPTHTQLLRIADLAWQAAFWRYRKISAPIMADAYIRAYRAAGAGDVPMSVIYDLADKHAEKIGDYFQASSRDALADGFNVMVNRRLPAKAAADRVLDAYGLTRRQMRGYTSNKQLMVPVESAVPMNVRARARAYIDKSFTTRIRKLARQEEHNVDEQAKQFAWMWMQDKGKLSEKAQKLWITAKDERVCPVCGPLHGQKVLVGEQFRSKEGLFWTPGLHPNCRCVVRLLENRFSKADWDPKEHPRGYHGRFGNATRTKTIDVDTEFEQITKPKLQPLVDQSTDVQLDQLFHSVVTSAIKPQTTARQAITPGKVSVVGSQAKTKPQVQTARPKVVLSRPQAVTNQITAAIVTPQTKVALAQQIATQLQAKTKPDTSVKIISGTKAPVQSTGKTLYHLTTGEMFKGNRLKLGGEEFISDPREIAEQASDLVEHIVRENVGSIILGKKFPGFTDRTDGTQYKLNAKQVQQVVEYYARVGQTSAEFRHMKEMPKMLKDPLIGVSAVDISGNPLLDETGHPVTGHFSAAYLGDRLDLDYERFEVRIVATNEGFAGQTEPLEMSTDLDEAEKWAFDGIFQVKPNSVERTKGQKFNVTMLEVEPVREQPKHD